MIIEHGFPLFLDEEIEVGLHYAAQKDHVRLEYGRLRRLANDAGKNRINAEVKLTPKQAALRAIRGFEREYPAVRFRPEAARGYVHAIAKMLSERNPVTKAKRKRDAEAAEILALSYKIDETPEIDPELNRQLRLHLTGAIYEEK